MKKKKLVITFLFLLVATLAWWFAPKRFLKSIDASEVSVVSVRNGGNGEFFEIKDKDEIRFIINNTRTQKFQKSGVSLFRMGTWYRLTFYDINGKQMTEFYINSDNTIRKDPFFYQTEAGALQMVIDYLNEMEK